MKKTLLTVLFLTVSAGVAAAETCDIDQVEELRAAITSGDTASAHAIYENSGMLTSGATDAATLDSWLSSHSSCAQISRLRSDILFLDKTFFQSVTEQDMTAQGQLYQNMINGAKGMISSRQPPQVAAGLRSLQQLLSGVESRFAGSDAPACKTQGFSGISTNMCNPVPLLNSRIEREFNRRDWPVQTSPSAAYGWMAEQAVSGNTETRQGVASYANIAATELLTYDFGSRIVHADAVKQVRASQEQRRTNLNDEHNRQFAEKGANGTAHETFGGSRPAKGIADRAVEAFWNVIGGFIAWLLIGGVFAMPFIGQMLSMFTTPIKAARGMFLVALLAIPANVIYILFGGLLPNLAATLGGAKWLVALAIIVPLAVLLQRTAFYARLWSLLPARLRAMAAIPRSVAQTQAPAGDTHGTAHWSTTTDAINRGRVLPAGKVLADSHGFALGRVAEGTKKALEGMDSRLRYMGHMLTVAPTGGGKGVGAVIPTLLEYPGSMVVLDIKGENYAVTARHRREVLGHEIHLIDPFGITGGEASDYNWLDRLDPASDDLISEAGELAEMLIVADGSGGNSEHFNETAKTFLRGLLVHVATLPESERNMAHLRRLITGSMEDFALLLDAMIGNPAGDGLAERAAYSILNTPEKERGSILSTVRRHLDFLDDRRLSSSLSRSGLDLNDLKRKPMTVYLVIPANRLKVSTAYVRAFIGQSLAAITATVAKPDYKVVFLLDEFAQLGRMKSVEDAISLVRGYGAAFWLFVQDLSQLKAVYPKWQTFLANSAKQFFGTDDFDTAKFISESLGKKTIEYATESHNAGMSMGQNMSRNDGDGVSQQIAGRELLTPDEVMRLPSTSAIVLVRGEAPYMVDRLNYLRDPEYAGQFDANPYH